MSLQIRKCKEGIQFATTLQPRSSKNQIVGFHNNALKIRLTSPPVEGAANKMCVRFLAKVLAISPARVSIIKGLTSRNKTLRVEGMDENEFLTKIMEHLPGPGNQNKNV